MAEPSLDVHERLPITTCELKELENSYQLLDQYD